MIRVLDANNKHNDAVFNNSEMVLACEYMQMLADRQNNVGCSLTLNKDGELEKFIIN